MLTVDQEVKIMKELEKYDTPTISNVIATYPNSPDTCLGLYNPWKGKWYTDQTLKCMYPELGPRCGYAVTCTHGMPDSGFNRLKIADIIREIDRSPKPVIIVVKQNFPPEIKEICGLMGGNLLTAYQCAGAVGAISDGPSRDVDEIRPMGMQYMITGITAGHGAHSVEAINTPVEVCGMMVAPGEILHMDENGVVKFPRQCLEGMPELAAQIIKSEQNRQKIMREKKGDIEEVIKAFSGLYD